jgi:hypothetical protein
LVLLGGNPLAVTDEAGRVRGVDGLRIADASLFPAIPCANTNLPTIMSDGLRGLVGQGRRGQVPYQPGHSSLRTPIAW